jgi:hypothetical protein
VQRIGAGEEVSTPEAERQGADKEIAVRRLDAGLYDGYLTALMPGLLSPASSHNCIGCLIAPLRILPA